MVLVHLATAVICFGTPQTCEPILYGRLTPVGEYQLILREVLTPGYGGDILEYFEDDKQLLGIHRLWLLNPKQHRPERMKDLDPKQHVITDGCINVLPEVYERLKDCCSNDKLVITQE